MAIEETKKQAQQEKNETEQPAWYDFLINIFKKLLGFNYFTYGTKKKF